MTVLLDANVLIAITIPSHVHHEAASDWMAGGDFGFATCPTTEGSLVRLVVREGGSAAAAQVLLRELAMSPRHEFRVNDVPYVDVRVTGIIGHRQVTDAYLAQLCRAKGVYLATFDAGLASLHDDVAVLVPTG